ncbi:MAG: DNA replication/repair protein RecF [Candidatus Zhuqueibacterota bacterium]
MILNSIELADFRNYQHVSLEFSAHNNFFIGNNAQGKTNLLEAIYLLCLSKSFRTKHEKEAILFSAEKFLIKGDFLLNTNNLQKIFFDCSIKQGKDIYINRKRLSKISELIGNFPVVISSPEEYDLTLGPPPERRKFVDILLSQIYKKYFSLLQDYHRIVLQRNSVLSNWKFSGSKTPAFLEPWDEKLIQVGSDLTTYRKEFSLQFSEKISTIYSKLVSSNEKLSFEYKPNIPAEDNDEIKNRFKEKLAKNRKNEIQRGTCLIGPHRDDFVFKINGRELKKYGSRGQHKTVLITLVIAEANLIEERKNEKPVILIDDLYSELDVEREKKILHLLNGMGQIFITSTSIHHHQKKNEEDRYFFISNGCITTENT